MTARSQKFQNTEFARLVKKIQFGKISAQRLVITAEKVWSHCRNESQVLLLRSKIKTCNGSV
jgi:hypothetical protein